MNKAGKDKYPAVFTNGRFDGIHAGHLQLFEEVFRQCSLNIPRGGYVMVGVDTDKRYAEVTGRTPRYSEHDRMAVVQTLLQGIALTYPGEDCPRIHVFPMNYPPSELIPKVRIYVKGADALDNQSEQLKKDIRVAFENNVPVYFAPVKFSARGEKLSSSAARGFATEDCRLDISGEAIPDHVLFIDRGNPGGDFSTWLEQWECGEDGDKDGDRK